MNIDDIIKKVMSEANGFKIKEASAKLFVENYTLDLCFTMVKEFFDSPHYQIKVLGVFILGNISADSEEALYFLKNKVSKNDNWRVQETLAMAFCCYYNAKGYKKALPVMNEWLNDGNPNLRRAVTEGLRIWTNRDYFRDNPGEAIKILSKYKKDESEYVRKSVGNALKDIGKKYKELILAEVNQWDLTDKKIKQTFKHAMKLINNEEAKQ